MNGRGVKVSNDYAAMLKPHLYADMPKAVVAAIAVSYASAGGDRADLVQMNIAREWLTLYQNGIVAQEPPGYVKQLAAQADRQDEANRSTQ